MNEGDLVAHIKSTDLDMQQDNLESQLKIYQTQVDQYNKLLQCIQDDTNYFSETSVEDQLLLPVRDLQEPGGAKDL